MRWNPYWSRCFGEEIERKSATLHDLKAPVLLVTSRQGVTFSLLGTGVGEVEIPGKGTHSGALLSPRFL